MNNMIRVFSGTEILVNLLQDELEQINIYSLIQNNFNSGVLAGFSGGFPSGIDLYISREDIEKAEPVISEFINRNKDNS